jgi:hypothetical protein
MNQTQHPTTSNVHLQTWVPREFKEHFTRVAKAQGLSESALLRRLLEHMVVPAPKPDDLVITPVEELPSARRVSVRLRADDLLLLRERAEARGLPTSIYITYLVRSHLMAQAPLPAQELAALKMSVAEIGAIGRNINQIARAVNQQQWPSGPDPAVLSEMTQVLTAMRAHIKALINANSASWDSGYGTTPDWPGFRRRVVGPARFWASRAADADSEAGSDHRLHRPACPGSDGESERRR